VKQLSVYPNLNGAFGLATLLISHFVRKPSTTLLASHFASR
jgi:hypothetical protein